MEHIGSIDSLKLTVLCDDNTGITKQFLSQHGFCLLLEIHSNTVNKNILFDTGQSTLPIFHNMNLLDIKPSCIDMIMLSHAHNDHTGGLISILEAIDKETPIIAHPDLFKENFSSIPFLRYTGCPYTKQDIINKKGKLLLSKEPIKLLDGILFSGQIKTTSYPCLNNSKYYNLVDGKKVVDEILDDTCLILNIKSKGLLIITGCCHSGIMNTISHAIDVTGINEIYGIIGGLHLVNTAPSLINTTLHELYKFKLQTISLGHCTGVTATHKCIELFLDKCTLLHSGKILEY